MNVLRRLKKYSRVLRRYLPATTAATKMEGERKMILLKDAE